MSIMINIHIKMLIWRTHNQVDKLLEGQQIRLTNGWSFRNDVMVKKILDPSILVAVLILQCCKVKGPYLLSATAFYDIWMTRMTRSIKISKKWRKKWRKCETNRQIVIQMDSITIQKMNMTLFDDYLLEFVSKTSTKLT